MKSIDCTRIVCPQPVIRTKEFLDNNKTDALCVIVDNKAASENIFRFLSNQGFEVSLKENEEKFEITGRRNENFEPLEKQSSVSKNDSILIMFTQNTIGVGDKELGSKLMLNFISTLKEMGDSLWCLVFVNEGVKLTVNSSETVKPLLELEENGIRILVCGTCLEYFNLLDKKQVGETTNMLDIVTNLQVATKVINF